MIQRRLAIVQLRGTPNVPGLLSYVPPPEPPAAQPGPTMSPEQWIVAGLATLAGIALLNKFLPGAKR